MDTITDYLVHYIIPILIAVFMFFVIALITIRLTYQYFKYHVRITQAKVNEFLAFLLISPFKKNEFIDFIEIFKKEIPFHRKWCKIVVLKQIISLKQNISDEETEKIHFIYEQFGLFKYCLKLLRNPDIMVKSRGINNFHVLEYQKAIQYIKPFLNSKNKVLLSNAYITAISLDPNELDFLINYKKPISSISEMKVMDILYQKNFPMPTNSKKFLNAENPSIIKLGLKLMAFYNQEIKINKIKKLLSSPDETIRYEVIITIRELFITEAEKLLIAKFSTESLSNQLEIIKTLGVIGTKKTELFFEKLLFNDTDSELKLAIVSSLNILNPTYFITKNNFDEEIEKMIKHVKNIYI